MASTVKHLRSSTANKRPTASGLADGQLGINTASGTPGVFFKDSAGTVVKVGPAHVGSTAPNVSPAGSAGNSLGELWVNNSTTINGLNYYTGSAFVNLTPSGTTTVAGLVELATNAETLAGIDTIRAVTSSGLQSKISDSTSTTSSTTIASATAVKTAYDLANAALPKSGGRVTGALEIGPVGSLVFEGSSDDSFETTIAVVNPTAARTITLPNVTGTVVTTGDSNTVTGTMIAATTITNAEISASAAIALSKLATGALPTAITVASANIVDATIVDADISNSAGIVYSKLALSSGIVNTDISASAAIALSKLATGALPTGITIASGNIVDGTIINADINASAAIALSKLATGALPTAITVASANLADGTIVNADISDTAAIDGYKVDPFFGSATVTCGAVNLGAGIGGTTDLDSYEEGTWTPVVSDASTAGNTATGTFYGHYTVIGNLCTATVSLANITTTGMTAANDLFIQGLPFTADSLTGTVIFTGAVELSSCTVVKSPCLDIIDNGSYIRIAESEAAAGRDFMIVSEFTSGSADVYGTITYQIA